MEIMMQMMPQLPVLPGQDAVQAPAVGSGIAEKGEMLFDLLFAKLVQEKGEAGILAADGSSQAEEPVKDEQSSEESLTAAIPLEVWADVAVAAMSTATGATTVSAAAAPAEGEQSILSVPVEAQERKQGKQEVAGERVPQPSFNGTHREVAQQAASTAMSQAPAVQPEEIETNTHLPAERMLEQKPTQQSGETAEVSLHANYKPEAGNEKVVTGRPATGGIEGRQTQEPVDVSMQKEPSAAVTASQAKSNTTTVFPPVDGQVQGPEVKRDQAAVASGLLRNDGQGAAPMEITVEVPATETKAPEAVGMAGHTPEQVPETPAQTAHPVLPEMQKVTEVQARQLQTEKGPVDHEQIMAQVKEQLEFQPMTKDQGEVTLKLRPAELGELKIRLQMADQVLKVEIVAQNQTVKDALMQNMDTLRETLSRQNITMDRFAVSTGGQGPEQGFREGKRTGRTRSYPSLNAATGVAGADDAPTVATHWKARGSSLIDLRL
ncbi:flagellar hook-length control protein FliK [Geobacter sp. DSM 9736]|uniref:flagellar hook-length control protein FliK n=1 Tax=Geobacter sp. DSM 9736 TaxID=1277350 RepID=UPI000B501FBC|nr:flagellar hook-length control protein FliK [Geobacter sp. DSM 9736]SNB47056.1 hook-length control protein FliK [Geobacter sp. DSM 9736]